LAGRIARDAGHLDKRGQLLPEEAFAGIAGDAADLVPPLATMKVGV
jgi:hypothetical protein